MSVQNRRVDVTQHARTRWLQRVSSEDPYPGSSVREAFRESSQTDTGSRIRGYHDDLNVLLIAVKNRTKVTILTVYRSEKSQERGGR